MYFVDEGRKELSRRAGAALGYLSALACELQGFLTASNNNGLPRNLPCSICMMNAVAPVVAVHMI